MKHEVNAKCLKQYEVILLNSGTITRIFKWHFYDCYSCKSYLLYLFSS